jgi:hypothetical protein
MRNYLIPTNGSREVIIEGLSLNHEEGSVCVEISVSGCKSKRPLQDLVRLDHARLFRGEFFELIVKSGENCSTTHRPVSAENQTFRTL